MELMAGLEWRPMPDTPGILVSQYKGKELSIVPVGGEEYNGHVDGEFACVGTNELEETAQRLIRHVNGETEPAAGFPLKSSVIVKPL